MDRFARYSDAVSNPARASAPIIPSASAILASIPKAIFVGVGGDIRLRCIDDSDPVTFRNVPSGSILPVRAAQVFPEGTSASAIVGLY